MDCGTARVVVGKLVGRLQGQSRGEGVVACLDGCIEDGENEID